MEKMHLKPSVWWKVFEKFRRKTKATVFLCLCTALQSVATNGIAQQKISLNLRQVALKEVFSELRRQTGYVILLSTADVDQYQKVSIQCRERSLTDFLDEFLKKLHLGYKIEEDYISIFKVTPPDTVEEFLIKGKVTDAKGVPLPGVTIRLDETTIGVASDNEGNFSLQVTKKTGIIVFSFVGYKTQKVNYIAGTPLVVKMQEDIADLEEVQVVAYGAQRKREITGSVSVVKADQFQGLVPTSIDNMLQGKVAGLNISSLSGGPGSRLVTSLRGYNSLNVEETRRFSDPLWIIDDVPLNTSTSTLAGTSPLATIDPANIESLTVLKDAAAAALYGSRAANGVILVTTKQGLIQEPELRIKVVHSIAQKPSLYERSGGRAERDLRRRALENYQRAVWDEKLGQYRYMESMWDSYINQADYNYFWNKGNGNEALILTDSLNPFFNNSTNLMKHFFQVAHTTSVNLDINGGTKFISGNASLGYYQEKGVLVGTGFKRISGNFGLKMRTPKRIQVNMRAYVVYVNRDRSGKGYNMYTTMIDPDIDQIPEFLITTSSLLPGPGSEFWDDLTRKYEEAKEKNASYRLRGSFDLKYEILRGLSIKSMVAADYANNHQDLFLPSTVNINKENFTSSVNSINLTLMNENFLAYKGAFAEGKHNVDALVGLSFQSDEMVSNGGYRYRGPSDKILYANSMDNAVWDSEDMRPLKNFSSDYQKSTMVGVFARLNYNFKEKYLLSGSIRWDASSKFGEDVRWGRFPAIAAGWIFSDEPFMDWSRSFFDYGKLRISYGLSGRQFDQPYIAGGVLEAGTPYLGYPTIQPIAADGLMNRKLTWEVTKQFDLGVDLDFFQHRLNLVFDYYNRYTDKLLYKVTIPGNYTGYAKQWQNAFGVRNQGVELALKGDLIINDDWRWNVSFNIARNWNILEKSTDRRDFNPITPLGVLQSNINVVGKPLNSLYVYKDAGIYNKQSEVPGVYVGDRYTPLQGSFGNHYYRPGDRVFTDVDGNNRILSQGTIADDRVFAGSPMPWAQGGFGSFVKWKNISLEIAFMYQLGCHHINQEYATLSTAVNDYSKGVMVNLNDIKFWEKDGDDATLPMNRADDGLYNFETAILSNVETVHFLKCKSIVFRYGLPPAWVKKMGFNTNLMVSMENCFTISNYSGLDPEAVDPNTGVDNLRAYPTPRKITFGIELNF